jgi:hypothetical protein
MAKRCLFTFAGRVRLRYEGGAAIGFPGDLLKARPVAPCWPRTIASCC